MSKHKKCGDTMQSDQVVPSISSTVAPTGGHNTSQRVGRGYRTVVVVLLTLTMFLLVSYTALSLYAVSRLVYVPPTPVKKTPASLGLQYHDVTFLSRDDHLHLRGWLIPGVLSNGALTTQRTIIMIHGNRTNRADAGAGLLDLSAALARHGFAVLAFDMRGMGESQPAPLSLGYFEQRDVLGAVDFLRSGPLPYPALGRPHIIGGWGVSMGAATLLLAAAQEPAIKAIVSDCAYAAILPILEREIPKLGHLPQGITPGILVGAQALYGINFYAVRPVDVVAQIAPRPILFIHGNNDHFIPFPNMNALATAAGAAPNAHVQTWLVPGADHAQSFHVAGNAYIARIVAFYTAALGANASNS